MEASGRCTHTQPAVVNRKHGFSLVSSVMRRQRGGDGVCDTHSVMVSSYVTVCILISWRSDLLCVIYEEDVYDHREEHLMCFGFIQAPIIKYCC